MSTVPLQVAILAAGRGTRLQPVTERIPKCLVPVGGTSPLEAALSVLEQEPGVGDVVLVVGHAAGAIDAFLGSRPGRRAIGRVFNPEWDTRNNIVSARHAAASCRGGFLLLNSDVLCAPAILEDAVRADGGSFLVVDEARPIRAEAMKVRYRGGRLEAIGKHLDPESADGEYIGIARFDGTGAAAFFEAIDRILARGGGGEWYEAAIGEAAADVPFALRTTRGLPWIEIDDHDDLSRAEHDVLPAIRRGAGRLIGETRVG